MGEVQGEQQPSHGVILKLDRSGKIVKEGSFECRKENYHDPDEEDTMPHMKDTRAKIFEA